jgi:cytochrome P450
MNFFTRLKDWLTGNKTQRLFFKILRSIKPVLTFGNKALIVNYNEVIETLERDNDFTISEINGPKLDALYLHFFLGMDATSPQFTQELHLMQSVSKREDMHFIRQLVQQQAAQCISKIINTGEIELVHDLTLLVPYSMMDKYFGAINGDVSVEKMCGWMRILFRQSFLNLNNNKEIEQEANVAAMGLKNYMEQLISKRKEELKADSEDNILNRLLWMQQAPGNEWITDDVIRRNVSGLMIGAVDTTSKSVVNIIDELFRHPEEFGKAIAAAKSNEIETVKLYCWEALRFNPHNPILLRYSKNESDIKGSESKGYKIKPGTTLFVAIMSAMFDKKVFINPMQFDVNRKTEYLHFGYGIHQCYGRYINAVSIPEIVAAILRLDNLRRAPGLKGTVSYDGPFPDKLVLKFGRQ